MITLFEFIFLYNLINLQIRNNNKSQNNDNHSTIAHKHSEADKFTSDDPLNDKCFNSHASNLQNNLPLTFSNLLPNKSQFKNETIIGNQPHSGNSHNSLNISEDKHSLESQSALFGKKNALFRSNLSNDYPFLKKLPSQEQIDKVPKQKMSKIIELDPENEFSKQAVKSNSTNFNLLQSNTPKQRNNHHHYEGNYQNIPYSNSSEQKALIDQLIEVDGVVVFEQETEIVIYANQNILNLLDTDQSHVLQEIQSLKHMTQFSEEKQQTNDFSTSNILRPINKDGNINSSPLISAFVNTSRLSKIGSNSLLNQVIEEDENEHDQIPPQQNPNEKQSREQESNQGYNANFKKQVTASGSKNITLSQNKKKDRFLFSRQISQQHFTKSKSPTNGVEISAAAEEEDENNPLKIVSRKIESMMKGISNVPQQQQNFSNTLISDFLNNTPIPMQDSNNTRVKRISESQDFPFPSFLSLIGNYLILFNRPRKNTGNNNNNQNNQGSTTTLPFERERNNTLKELIEDIRSKSCSVFALQQQQQQLKNALTNKKKILKSKKIFQQLNYSLQPEVVIENMVLFKEENYRLYLAKYSMVEHAGKILHIITIRDISNEIFEQILERQSSLFIEELYKHLNFSALTSVVSKITNNIKDIKSRIDEQDYINLIRPIKVHLRVFSCLLGDVLDVRSFQVKDFRLNIDFFDLKVELNRVKKSTEMLKNDVMISFYFDKQIPIQIFNDKQRISQILTNLLLNTSQISKKIFLKAKLCPNNENMIKIIIHNRELSSLDKEDILKAFTTQTNNALGYHLFISNLLAKHISNHKKQLSIISTNPHYINNSHMNIQLPIHSNNLITPTQEYVPNGIKLHSLSHLDDIKFDEADSYPLKMNTNLILKQKSSSPSQKLYGDSNKQSSSKNIITSSKCLTSSKNINISSSKNQKNPLSRRGSDSIPRNLHAKIKKQSTFEIYSYKERDIQSKQLIDNENQDNISLSINSIEKCEFSEQLETQKNIAIEVMQDGIHTKFMQTLPQKKVN